MKRRNVSSLATPAICVIMSFFFNDTATTEIYTLSLHDALPISRRLHQLRRIHRAHRGAQGPMGGRDAARVGRSEEHTSELQSRRDLVCRLLLEKKKRTVGGGPRSTRPSLGQSSPADGCRARPAM